MTSSTTTASSADRAARSTAPAIPDPAASRTGSAWVCSSRTSSPSSETQTENSDPVLMAATVRWRPIAIPSGQPLGRPGSSGSGARSSSNGAITNVPVSSPVSSRNQTTPVPSRVGRPSSTPTGSVVTWRRLPVRRSHACSWYEPLSVEAITRRSGSPSAQAGKDRMGVRKRCSQAG